MVQSAQMLEEANLHRSALLCFERDPKGCHRSILIDRVAPDAEVVDLFT
jgi:hypothetical protein